MRGIEELKITTNPNVYWKINRKKVLDCSWCKPNRFENLTWQRLRYNDNYKNHRRNYGAQKIKK